MPATKVLKPQPVEATGKTVEKSKPAKVKAVTGAESELKAPAVRKSRASSCPRCPQRDRCERATTTGTGTATSTTASKTTCERRRARSTSVAPKPTSSVKHGAVNPRSREPTTCPGQRQQRSVRPETKYASQSHKAFTVIPPNPKKRRDMQRKAEAELAALEELRLSRAMAYVSINPSSVGGCMSLEEVRLKQQQEMMEAKRKQKPMKTQVMEQTPVLMR
ncbi:uncharacterized protein LOC111647290 [Seriola lalandi dorsalis]|uniref:uncharacterized protein LOC111647290 n=1 Tax=Seriola lalandi dorsalis TaxID=1841481 RepID=UPI000C6FA494|nr:uncharacterized protein LOC111647290 [Seriola lalandi dorsalis]XP_056219940.1 uncharacterized protein zgc:194621 [Seriola aureovittata]